MNLARPLALEYSTSVTSFTPVEIEIDGGGEGRRLGTMESPTGSNTRIEAHFSDAQRSHHTTPVSSSGWDPDSEAEVVEQSTQATRLGPTWMSVMLCTLLR